MIAPLHERRQIARAIRSAEGVPGGAAPPPSARFPILSVMLAAIVFFLETAIPSCPKCNQTYSRHDAEQSVCVPCGVIIAHRWGGERFAIPAGMDPLAATRISLGAPR